MLGLCLLRRMPTDSSSFSSRPLDRVLHEPLTGCPRAGCAASTLARKPLAYQMETSSLLDPQQPNAPKLQ